MLYTIADKRVPSTVPRLEGTVVSSNSYQALAPFQYIALIATERKNGATAAITGGSSSPEAERGRQEGAGRPGRAAAGEAEERRPQGRRGRGGRRGAEGAAERRGGGPLHPTPTTRRPEDAASLFLPPGGAWRPLPRRLLAVAGGGSLSGRCPSPVAVSAGVRTGLRAMRKQVPTHRKGQATSRRVRLAMKRPNYRVYRLFCVKLWPILMKCYKIL